MSDGGYEILSTSIPDTSCQLEDDASSLASTGLDTESEAEDEAAAASDVTLQMPNLDIKEYMSLITSQTRNRSNYEFANPVDVQSLRSFDIKSDGSSIVPLFVVGGTGGAELVKKQILRKIAAALLSNFTSDAWSSEMLSIIPTSQADYPEVELLPQSKLSLSVKSFDSWDTICAIKAAETKPLFIIFLVSLSDDRKHMPLQQDLLSMMQTCQTEQIFCLPLLEAPAQCQIDLTATDLRPDHILFRKICTESQTMMFQIADINAFLSCDGGQLSQSTSYCLDYWFTNHVSIEEKPSPTGKRMLRNQKIRSFDPYFLQLIKILTIVLIFVGWGLWLSNYSMRSSDSIETSLLRPNTCTTNDSDTLYKDVQLELHLITDTTALLEFPSQVRQQGIEGMPSLQVNVSRGETFVPNLLQLVVDNLYCLDWAAEDAYGEISILTVSTSNKIALKKVFRITYGGDATQDNQFPVSLMPKTDTIREIQETRPHTTMKSHFGYATDIRNRLAKFYASQASVAGIQLRNLLNHPNCIKQRLRDTPNGWSKKGAIMRKNLSAKSLSSIRLLANTLKTVPCNGCDKFLNKAKLGVKNLRQKAKVFCEFDDYGSAFAALW